MKKFKLFITSLSLILLIVIFSGCATSNLLDYVSNNTETDYASVLPKDGTNGIDGKDGKDGDQIDLFEVYSKLVELEEFGGTYSDFVKEYLNTKESVYATNKALTSVVDVYAGHTETITYQANFMQTAQFIEKSYGAGSGVIFRLDKETGDAYIITNYHVVYSSSADENISQDISIFVYGKEDFDVETVDSVNDIYGNQYSYKNITGQNKISATYLGGSMLYDIAVLKVSGSEILKQSDAQEATFANSDKIIVGEGVVAVGNASSMGLSATQGIVSVDSEYISMLGVDNQTVCTFRVIRTDSAVNGGNSGGGLFNEDGEVVGIVNAKITSSSIENIAYAIPSNIAVNVAKNIIRNCDGQEKLTVQRCLLGIGLKALSSSAVYDQASLCTRIEEKVAVASITQGSLSEGLLEVGDILTSVTINYANGQSTTKQIKRTFTLVDLSLTLSVGDTLILERTAHDGTQKTDVEVTFSSESVSEFA